MRSLLPLVLLTGACALSPAPAPEPAPPPPVQAILGAIADLQATTADQALAIADLQADLAVATQQIADLEARLPSDGASVPALVDAPTTLAVPGDHPSLVAALLSLADRRIAADAVVTVQIADGTYAQPAPIGFAHPDGDRIRIVGNPGNPSAVVLTFASMDGLSVSNGHTLGFLDGLTLRGSSFGGNYTGLRVERNATLVSGGNLQIEDFGGNGVLVSTGGVIDGQLRSTDHGRDCIEVRDGGILHGDGVELEGCSNAGLSAVSGGLVSGSDFFIQGHGDEGVLVNDAGVAVLPRVQVYDNLRYGVRARGASVAIVNDGSAINFNDGFGVVAEQASFVDTSGSSFEMSDIFENADAALVARENSTVDASNTIVVPLGGANVFEVERRAVANVDNPQATPSIERTEGYVY